MADGFTEDWLQKHQARMAGLKAHAVATPAPSATSIPAGPPADPSCARAEICAGPEVGGPDASPKSSAVAGALGPISKPRQKRPEQTLQIEAVKFLHLALPPTWRLVHVPNGVAAGGKAAKVANSIRKAMGVRSGFPDLGLLGPGRYVVAEAKAGKGRLRPEQAEWRDWFLSIGVPWFVFRNHDELVAGCLDAGVPLRVRL